MPLTPVTVRADLKCGKGAIPDGKKCTKGPATKVQGKQRSTKAGKAGKVLARAAGMAATTTGAAMMGNYFFNPKASPSQYTRGAALMGAGGGLNLIGQGKTRAGAKQLGAATLGIAASEGTNAFINWRRNKKYQQRQTLENIYRGPSANRGDSIWASGFAP